MLQPELKLRRDKIRALMAQQGIDAALITCNVNLIYTYGRVVSGYLYLPLNAPARLFIKRPNDIEGEHIHPIRKRGIPMKNTNKNMMYTFWSGAILLCLALVAVVLVFTNAVGNTGSPKVEATPAVTETPTPTPQANPISPIQSSAALAQTAP